MKRCPIPSLYLFAAVHCTCAAAVGLWVCVIAGCTNVGGNLEGPLLPAARRSVTEEDRVDDQTWRGWRGGSLHGVSPADALPLQFSHRRNVRWKTPLPGSGNSSPVVSRDHVFLTCVTGGSDHEDGRRKRLEIIAVDRRTGRIAWREGVGRPVGATHPRNGHASATPATDGENVYAYFGPKGLFCYTVDGQRRWHRPFSQQSHEWGAASSPVLAGGMVIQLVDSQSDSFLIACDQQTGSTIWRTPRDSNGCWTTPVVTRVQDRWQVVVNGSGSRDGSRGEIAGYDLSTGRRLWRIAGTSDIVCPTAIVGERWVVSTSGSNGPVIAIDKQSEQGAAPEVGWQFPTGGPYVPTGVLYQNRLYLVDDDGMLRCLHADDGRELWRQRLSTPVAGSLVAGAGRIYVTGELGDVFVVAAGDRFELLAKNSLRELCLATPAIAGEELYIRGAKHLYCISASADEAKRPRPAATDESTAEAEGGNRRSAIRSPSDLPVAPKNDAG